MKWLWFIIFGVVSGVLGGMGMGGGTLLIPLLTLVLNVEQLQAQGTNLIAFIPMSIIALIIHSKNHLIDKNNILYLIVPAIISAICAAFIANNLEGDTLRVAFGIFLVTLGIIQIILTLINKNQNNSGESN